MESNLNNDLYFILVIGSLGMAVLAGIVVCAVIYYQKRRIKHQNELQQAQLQYQLQLLQQSIEVQEKERKRFAEDLHDDAGAILSAVKLNLHRLAKNHHELVMGETFELLDTAISNIRRVSHDLSPPALEQFGLYQAVTDLLEQLKRTSQVKIHYQLEESALILLSKQVEISVYRLLNELLNNTLKHSEATEINIQMHAANENMVFMYSDNGCGFDSHERKINTKGKGLKNMESRIFALCGNMIINTAPGKGFQTEISFPVNLNV